MSAWDFLTMRSAVIVVDDVDYCYDDSDSVCVHVDIELYNSHLRPGCVHPVSIDLLWCCIGNEDNVSCHIVLHHPTEKTKHNTSKDLIFLFSNIYRYDDYNLYKE